MRSSCRLAFRHDRAARRVGLMSATPACCPAADPPAADANASTAWRACRVASGAIAADPAPRIAPPDIPAPKTGIATHIIGASILPAVVRPR
ncbi:hypothetical protein ACNSZF_32945 [Burkholderia gladioli]